MLRSCVSAANYVAKPCARDMQERVMIGKGGYRPQSDKTKAEAAERAQRLAPVMAELCGLSARAAAEELNRRGIVTAEGGKWHTTQVIRVRARLA